MPLRCRCQPACAAAAGGGGARDVREHSRTELPAPAWGHGRSQLPLSRSVYGEDRSHWQVAVSVPQLEDLPRPGQRSARATPSRMQPGVHWALMPAGSAGSGPRPAARSGPRPAVAGSLTIPPFPPGSARARTHQQTTTAEAAAREKRNGKRHERMTREKREIGPDTEEH